MVHVQVHLALGHALNAHVQGPCTIYLLLLISFPFFPFLLPSLPLSPLSLHASGSIMGM